MVCGAKWFSEHTSKLTCSSAAWNLMTKPFVNLEINSTTQRNTLSIYKTCKVQIFWLPDVRFCAAIYYLALLCNLKPSIIYCAAVNAAESVMWLKMKTTQTCLICTYMEMNFNGKKNQCTEIEVKNKTEHRKWLCVRVTIEANSEVHLWEIEQFPAKEVVCLTASPPQPRQWTQMNTTNRKWLHAYVLHSGGPSNRLRINRSTWPNIAGCHSSRRGPWEEGPRRVPSLEQALPLAKQTTARQKSSFILVGVPLNWARTSWSHSIQQEKLKPPLNLVFSRSHDLVRGNKWGWLWQSQRGWGHTHGGLRKPSLTITQTHKASGGADTPSRENTPPWNPWFLCLPPTIRHSASTSALTWTAENQNSPKRNFASSGSSERTCTHNVHSPQVSEMEKTLGGTTLTSRWQLKTAFFDSCLHAGREEF